MWAVAIGTLAPLPLHAQGCELDGVSQTALVEAIPGTTFLPNGGEGEIVVRKQRSASGTVAVLETSGPEPNSWKKLATPAVMSVANALEKHKSEVFLRWTAA